MYAVFPGLPKANEISSITLLILKYISLVMRSLRCPQEENGMLLFLSRKDPRIQKIKGKTQTRQGWVGLTVPCWTTTGTRSCEELSVSLNWIYLLPEWERVMKTKLPRDFAFRTWRKIDHFPCVFLTVVSIKCYDQEYLC